MIISQTALDAIKRNSRLKNRIAVELDCAPTTINKWMRERNWLNLTGVAARYMHIISEESGIPESDILVPEAALAQN